MSERFKRRCLYALTGFVWMVSLPILWAAITSESVAMRCWMVVFLVIASTLTTSSLFVFFMPPMEALYRIAYQDGLRAEVGHPNLGLVVGGQPQPGHVVVPIRPVKHFSRSDN